MVHWQAIGGLPDIDEIVQFRRISPVSLFSRRAAQEILWASNTSSSTFHPELCCEHLDSMLSSASQRVADDSGWMHV
jgi:hypothetical protein